MRVKSKVTVKIFEDVAEKNGLLVPDDELAETINDGNQELSLIRADIAALGTFTATLAPVGTPAGMYLKATGDFDLLLNGGTPLQVRRQVKAATGGAKATSTRFYYEGTIASVQITALADAISVTGAIWGDAAA